MTETPENAATEDVQTEETAHRTDVEGGTLEMEPVEDGAGGDAGTEGDGREISAVE